MRRGHDGFGIDDDTSTEDAATWTEDGGLGRELVDSSKLSPDNCTESVSW